MSEDVKKLEYTAAQEMLRHYDSLNWQIGALLIAATTVLTGLIFQKDVIALIQGKSILLSLLIVFGVPIFSGYILSSWYRWFTRHRELYNFRNETLHRLELELGMFHHLRIVETDYLENETKWRKKLKAGEYEKQLKVLEAARLRADGEFKRFYPKATVSGTSGFSLAYYLAWFIPALQFLLLGVMFLGRFSP